MIGVLNAGDVGNLKGAAQVGEGDAAQADCSDESVVTGRDHGGELVVEERIRSPISHQSKVDDWQGVDGEGSQVLLDSAAQLGGFVVGEDAAAVVSPGPDLADQDEPGRVGMERLVDQLVDDVRTVVLRGVDVVDPGLDGLAQQQNGVVGSDGGPKIPGPVRRMAP